jgi:hypothetical protein
VRATLLALAAFVAVAAGCGSSSRQERGTHPAGTLDALLDRPGADVSAVAGTSDYSPGTVRLSFLVVARDGQALYRPHARVWLANALRARPFEEVTADLEPVGVPGVSRGDPADVTHLYVAHLRVPRAGRYWYVAEPAGGSTPIQAVGNLDVKPVSDSPAVGSRAIPSRTPTLASVHGDTRQLTTRHPADRGLLRYSVADSLARHVPFVLVFATPEFCTSRTCGPVVDVVDSVRKRFDQRGIRFIHVEIYARNNPRNGFNRWVKEWRLPTEPWVFLVGRDGRIKAKFEGSVSAAELAGAVRRDLAR